MCWSKAINSAHAILYCPDPYLQQLLRPASDLNPAQAPVPQAQAHLLEQVVAEAGHQLRRRRARHVLVTEALKRLLERLVEQRRVGEARVHVLRATARKDKCDTRCGAKPCYGVAASGQRGVTASPDAAMSGQMDTPAGLQQ